MQMLRAMTIEVTENTLTAELSDVRPYPSHFPIIPARSTPPPRKATTGN